MDFQVCLFFLQTRKLWAATSLKMTKQPPPPNNNNNLTCTLLLMLTYNLQGLCLRASHPRSDCD